MLIKIFVLKNVKNKLLFYSVCGACIIAGLAGVFFDISFPDILGGLINE